MVAEPQYEAVGMQSVSVTEAKQTLTLLVDAVVQSNEAVMITRYGEPAVVLISFEAFENLRSSCSPQRLHSDR